MFSSLIRYDHLAVMLTPKILPRPERKHVFFRDVREHRKLNMANTLRTCDWRYLDNANDFDEAFTVFNEIIMDLFNEYFPLIKVKESSRDPPIKSPLVKHL